MTGAISRMSLRRYVSMEWFVDKLSVTTFVAVDMFSLAHCKSLHSGMVDIDKCAWSGVCYLTLFMCVFSGAGGFVTPSFFFVGNIRVGISSRIITIGYGF